MNNKKIARQINETIEDIWMYLEKKERAFTNFDLNNQQHVLLTLIIRYPNISPSELATKMEITKSAVSQQISKLESGGFIIRKQKKDDRRAYTIELAKKGQKYKRETELFHRQISEKYSNGLPKEELVNILTALQKLKNLL